MTIYNHIIMSNCIEMRVLWRSRCGRHSLSSKAIVPLATLRQKLLVWAINFRTCWETKNCNELQSIARLVDFNCVLMQLIAPCIRAFSITLAFTAVGCVLCNPHAWLSLVVVRDISKLDCTGQKVNRLCNRWAYINVFGLIWKRKNPAIP